MNIFAIERNTDGSIDWAKSAQSQDNYRVVKMILESTQMLCTNLNLLHGEQVTRYKNAHVNHPSTKWARESSDNFEALVYHTLAMLEEYTERFGKVHKCAGVLDDALSYYDPDMFPSSDPTPLPLCMPDEYKSSDIVESYRRFYASKPRMRYPVDKIPPWFRKYRKEEFQIIS